MNRLANEKSLYLKQHADNPVDWYPWCPEAFAEAKDADKPILISIGYSACHWCHVMADECFANPRIARLMNEHFVCIKVDREERPDVDQIYMDAVQMLNGQGGWPLNVFCMPDGRPFAGGTYFPPDETGGHDLVPWPQLLMRVSDFYQRQRQDLEENATAICGNLLSANQPLTGSVPAVDGQLLLTAGQLLLRTHDDEFGGFSGAPKFPPSMSLDFLLALRAAGAVEQERPALAARCDQVINTTLTAMSHGGIFDQIGGGFFRYSVDRHWLIPHFEKMLYDNALMLDIMAKAAHRYPKPVYLAVIEETVTWLLRELRLADGMFAAALDADTSAGEGHFYTWTPEEIAATLGTTTEAEAFCDSYGITAEGTFEQGRSQPALLEPDFAIREKLNPNRERLLEARLLRERPTVDTKCILAWNALAIRGLARAAVRCERGDWYAVAATTADNLWATFVRGPADVAAIAYGKEATGHATLDDYAYFAESLLNLAAVAPLFEHTGQAVWRARAEQLLDWVNILFADPEGGYFYTGEAHSQLFHRKKDWFDNSIPSGHSSLLHTFALLDLLAQGKDYGEKMEHLRSAYAGMAQKTPAAAAYGLSALTQSASGLAVLKIGTGIDVGKLHHALTLRPWRQVWIEKSSALAPDELLLCVGKQCLAPSTDIEACLNALADPR